MSYAEYKSKIRLPKMDCPCDEQKVRLSLSGMEQIVELSFDLSARMLTLYHKREDIREVETALSALGFGYEHVSTDIYRCEVKAEHGQRKSLYWLLAINASLFAFELLYGIFAHSSGLISDSLDMLADAMVYGVALLSVGQSYREQARSAKLAGIVQLVLAISVLIDTIRRFVYGHEPDSDLMIVVSIIALIGNAICLYIISPRRDEGLHMKASWIFSANDVLINCGVIVAGGLVMLLDSPIPDLVISLGIGLLVLNGARQILRLESRAKS